MTIDHRDLTRGLTHLQKQQAPYAAARALTDTAWGAVRGLEGHMRDVFDQPTRFTQKAFRAIGATKTNLEATVEPKSMQGSRHYLFTQEDGGPRPKTGIEKLLTQHAAFDGVLQAAVPADDARLNKFGNLSPAQIQRMLSGLGAQRDGSQNTTRRSRARTPARDTFFVPRHGLAPGVYARDGRGRLKIIMAFTDVVPVYSPRLGYQEFVERVMEDEFPGAFWRWLDRAMRSAR
ncbi:MAG: hypothetical protein AAFY75_04190 [Pseudomonadota bacterium]